MTVQSAAETLAQAIVIALTVPPLTGVTADEVLRDPLDALDSETFPLLAVELGDEPDPQLNVTNSKDRAVQIRVHVFAKGPKPLLAADPIATEASARILADPTLGGLALDIDEGATERSPDEFGMGAARVTTHWVVRYRTAYTSKEF